MITQRYLTVKILPILFLTLLSGCAINRPKPGNGYSGSRQLCSWRFSYHQSRPHLIRSNALRKAKPFTAITPTYSIRYPKTRGKLPLVFWHGFGQFSKTWETTPDGREGFQNIFLRRDFSVYLLDQPRRGRASRSMVEATIRPTPDEQFWFNVSRIGVWPDYFPGVQFAKGEESLNQSFRQMTPNIGGFDEEVITDATSKLFDKIGKGILVTHSHSGGFGWSTAMKNSNVRAIVSYEPGSGFPFSRKRSAHSD